MDKFDRYEDDAAYLRMFDRWPCNTFKPHSHIVANHDEMHMIGKDVCEGYFGVLTPRKLRLHGEWTLTLADGSKWTYRTTKELLTDWRIARTWEEYLVSSREMRTAA